MADEHDSNQNVELDDASAEKLLAEPDEPGTEQAPELGDAGKKALDVMKRERNAARKDLADLQARLKKYEDDGKSESQRLQEALVAHQSRAEKAESALKRREIAELAAPEYATAKQIAQVAKRMAGDGEDALEADARELFEWIAPAPSKAKTPERPKERLKGGSEPDEPVEETDPRKLAARIPRGQLR